MTIKLHQLPQAMRHQIKAEADKPTAQRQRKVAKLRGKPLGQFCESYIHLMRKDGEG